ncbi:glycosyltransferase [Streptomyces sp. NPDC058052]|uniref:glycosyltransferase n=1 Tax=Streptomyces sp. NPDC058052 TaxID=3346316 RepID=UPI0036E6738D
MRVVVSAYGARGSVEPMVGLAVRLRERGAEVRVCAPPDEEFTELLAEAGVPSVPVGAPVRPLVTTVKPGSAEGLAQRAADLMAAQFGAVADAADGCDVLVATGPLPVTTGARSVAERLGIRYVYVTHTPVVLPAPHQPPPGRRGRPLPPEVRDNRELWDLDARLADDMFGGTLEALRASVGLPPVRNVRDYAFTDRPWLAADPVLSPWPPSGPAVVPTGAWLRPDDRPLPPAVVAFLDAGAPPVYVGFGSTPLGTRAPDLARAAVEAIRERGHRAIVSRGWAGLAAPDDGDDCLTVDEVDHRALFPRLAAVVHHGSGGTTTTAARAGVPQVIVAQGGDQPYWADRVTALGIGVAYDGPTPAPGSLSAALATALRPATRARAETVRGTVRSDGASVAARLLYETAGRRRRGLGRRDRDPMPSSAAGDSASSGTSSSARRHRGVLGVGGGAGEFVRDRDAHTPGPVADPVQGRATGGRPGQRSAVGSAPQSASRAAKAASAASPGNSRTTEPSPGDAIT